jgi:hypothetical protein
MKAVHYIQAALAGVINCALTLAVILPAPWSHYLTVGTVGLVAFLAPLGILSPSAMKPDTAALDLLSQIQNNHNILSNQVASILTQIPTPATVPVPVVTEAPKS